MATYTSAYTGEEIDRRLAYVGYLEQLNSEPVGMKIENATSSPKVTVVDRNGNPLNPDADFFHNHVIWGSMYKCVIDPQNGNNVTFGSNPRGDGLTLDGSAGNVMVRTPNVKYRYELDGTDQYIWYAPFDSNAPYFDYFPTCYQGTGKLHDHFYMAAHEASGFLDSADSKFKLISATGKQPITGEVNYPDLPNNGRFNIDDALTYARNIGTGWSIGNAWSYALLQGLSYIQYGTRDLQTAVGKGIVDLPSGEGFAGKLTGSDDIDNRLDIWGCGVGSGVNGQTPTAWNNLENFVSGGNVWEFIAGINMMATDGSVRVINPDGTGILAGELSDGNYITLPGKVPMTDGYISGIQTDPLGAITFTPSAALGSSSTYFADYFGYPRYNPSVVRFGGGWDSGSGAGVGCRIAGNAASLSFRKVGARLEFHPPEVVV
jgi:hypothetical protein